VNNGELYHVRERAVRLVPSERDIVSACEALYDRMGHFSFSTIITWLKERFWHPALSTLARTHVTGCESCTRFNMKRSHYRFDGARRQSNVTRVIAVDFAGPFPKDGKVRYVIVAVEVVTGYPFAKAVTTATAHEAAEFLINEVFSFVGIPSVFLSDHGTHFDNHLIAALASTYNFTHRFSPPTTSQVNGQAERTIQSIQNILYKTVYQFERPGRAWAYLIPQALFAMRIKPNSRTKVSPIYLLLGVEPRLPPDPLDRPEEASVDNPTLRDLDLIKVRCLRYLLQLESLDRPKKQVRAFEPGDRVLVLDARVLKGMKLPRFVPRFKGPYVVSHQKNRYDYYLQSANQRRLKNSIHVSRLKPYGF